MLALIAESGGRGSFVLEGRVLVGIGGPAEGADAGRDRPVRGRLRGGQMALRHAQPLPDRGRSRLVLAAGLQLADPGVDGVQALPGLLPAGLGSVPLVVHAPSMPHRARLLYGPVAVRRSRLVAIACPAPATTWPGR